MYFIANHRMWLFPFAPTTASRSPSPARAGEAWLRSAFSQNHAILASPADAGERSTSANHTSFYSCSWDVFPYDLFPVQLCPMGLLLGQVSKWRAQRADRGAHAARGFVGGAALHGGRHALFTASFNAARGFVGGATRAGFWNGVRPSVSMPHAALWVVQLGRMNHGQNGSLFQCRTRLFGWCSQRLSLSLMKT